MIRYDLKCPNGHGFEGWFRSSADFDAQAESGALTCPQCGAGDIAKALMAPSVPRTPDTAQPAAHPLERLREWVDTHSEDTGRRFATEARAIHDGAAPARPIHGEASPDEVRSLLEDEIPVLPLPIVPKKQRQ